MKKYLLLSFMSAILLMTLSSFYQTFDMKASVARGEEIYQLQCVSCHQAEGEGIEGAFPPLAKSDHLADKSRLVQIVLRGMRGALQVKGVEYNGEMTGLELTDQQTSDVLNYIRNTWGNKGQPIRPAEIQPALKVKSPNYQPY